MYLAFMPDQSIPEVLEIDTIEGFDALISPQRLQLAEILAIPRSAKEAAEELGVPVTRLYYHLNSMLEQGLVRVVDERPRGALKERVFQVAGKAIRPSKAFLDRYGSEGVAEVSALAFRHAETRFGRAAKAGLVGLEQPDGPRTGTIGLSNLTLTPERLDELVRRIEALLEEFRQDTGDLPVSLFQATHIREGQG
jgi:DNA-binding transcriptional ArsR family regulator